MFIECTITNATNYTEYQPFISINGRYIAFYRYSDLSVSQTYTGVITYNRNAKLIVNNFITDSLFNFMVNGSESVITVKGIQNHQYTCYMCVISSEISRDLTYIDYSLDGFIQLTPNIMFIDNISGTYSGTDIAIDLPNPSANRLRSFVISASCRNTDGSTKSFLLFISYTNTATTAEIAVNGAASTITYEMDNTTLHFKTTTSGMTVKISLLDNFIY